MLEDRDPNVREETKQLSIEIYRWVKDALLPQLSNLKPILLDSLKEEFEKVKDSKAKPERLLRSQQQRVQDEADGGAVPGAEVCFSVINNCDNLLIVIFLTSVW